MARLRNLELPSSTNIIAALNRIIKAFENPIEIEVTKTRWEEIKKLQKEQIFTYFEPSPY
jgi:uncharacterized radical SAM superfamily protein